MRRFRFDFAIDKPGRDACHRFTAHKPAVHGVGALAAIALLGFLEPLLRAPLGAGAAIRAIDATHTTLAAALLAGVLAMLLGTAWSVLALLLGGRPGHGPGHGPGRALDRAAGWLAGLPLALLPALVAAALGPGLGPDLLIVGVALSAAPAAAVAARRTLRARPRREYAMAARSVGLTPLAVLVRHTAPNLAGPLLAALWPALPRALAVSSFTGMLGLGVPPGVAIWGGQIGAALSTPSLMALLPPALLLAATLAALHTVGDGLAHAFDADGEAP